MDGTWRKYSDLGSIWEETGQDCNSTRRGSKNCSQTVETTSEILATPSGFASDDVRIFETVSKRNRLKEAIEDSAKRRHEPREAETVKPDDNDHKTIAEVEKKSGEGLGGPKPVIREDTSRDIKRDNPNDRMCEERKEVNEVDEECEESEEEVEDDPEYINTNPSSPSNPSISFITKKVCKLNSLLESLNLVLPSSNTQFISTKENDEDVMFVELIKKHDDSSEEELGVDENVATEEELGVEYFDKLLTRIELTYHKNSSSLKRVHFINTITTIRKEEEPKEGGILEPNATKNNDHDIIVEVEEKRGEEFSGSEIVIGEGESLYIKRDNPDDRACRDTKEVEKVEEENKDLEVEKANELMEYEEPFDLVDIRAESVYESLIKKMPSCSLSFNFRNERVDPSNLKIPFIIGGNYIGNAYIDLDSPMNVRA
ncbi:hypothetical protein Tco_0152352 [Tanacetum coccineum]